MQACDSSDRAPGCLHAAPKCLRLHWASLTVYALLAVTAQSQGRGAEESAPLNAGNHEPVAEPARSDAAAREVELEKAGARIRAINVIVANVFDPSNSKEDKPIYRWANNVHVRTHDSVIEGALLFRVGDRYEARVLDESARTLRGRGYLADVKIGAGSYDSLTNTVDVDAKTRS